METKWKSSIRYSYWFFFHLKEVVDCHESIKVGSKRKAEEVTKESAMIKKRIKDEVQVIDNYVEREVATTTKGVILTKMSVDQSSFEDSMNEDKEVIKEEIATKAAVEKKEDLVMVTENEEQLGSLVKEVKEQAVIDYICFRTVAGVD